MKRIFSALSLAALCGLAHAQPSEPARPYVEEKTGLTFPHRLGTLQLRTVHSYPDPRAGVLVRYESPMARADFFVYDAGISGIPTGGRSEVVRAEFDASRQRMLRAMNTSPAKDGKEILTAEPSVESKSRQGHAGTLRASQMTGRTAKGGEDTAVVTWLVITGYRNQFFKLLFSSYGEDTPTHETGMAKLREFVFAFGEANDGQGKHFFVPVAAPDAPASAASQSAP